MKATLLVSSCPLTGVRVCVRVIPCMMEIYSMQDKRVNRRTSETSFHTKPHRFILDV